MFEDTLKFSPPAHYQAMAAAASGPLRTEDGPLDLAVVQRMVAESNANCWSIMMVL